MTSEQDFEKEIQERNLNAPRLTPDMIHDAIVKTEFHVFEGSNHTVCLLTLRNGFTVTGENACVSKENWRRDIGERESYSQARDKVWMLEAYVLKEKLFNDASAFLSVSLQRNLVKNNDVV